MSKRSRSLIAAAALAAAGVNGGLARSAFAAVYGTTFDTVGTLDPNGFDTTGGGTAPAGEFSISNATGFTATGGATQVTLSAFTSNVASAYSSDTGGVINFDYNTTSATTSGTGSNVNGNGGPNYLVSGPGANQATGSTSTSPIVGLFGTSLSQTFGFYRSDASGSAYDYNTQGGTGEQVSGTGYLGIQGANTNTMTFVGTTISAFGITDIGRNGGGNTSGTYTLTFSDGTTATESSGNIANAPNGVFFGFAAPAGTSIVSATFTQTSAGNSNRFDDLAFIAVPEPASLSIFAVGSLVLLRRRKLPAQRG